MLTPYASWTSSADCLTAEIQHALAKLADVETEIEIECERLERWPGPADEKEHLLAQLETERQRRRAPLAQRLTELQQRLMARIRVRPLHQPDDQPPMGELLAPTYLRSAAE
ncbi:hypothetical protein Mnod_7681 (plasmid) [Methylobacterium nodulans ORS 2060]|uniref:Uncharacterized protein n=1 Tax=Methylobacterium nodulans (strain LMG 21967 / CNCM I-2342 / ORS 2060) TaxID=460265 RepID=B8IXY5_METNO|nr:hypothetical protein Mnod_7681 [Methylobacterium nodulans ORS 2060]